MQAPMALDLARHSSRRQCRLRMSAGMRAHSQTHGNPCAACRFLSPARAALAAKERHGQEPPSGLVGDFKLDVARIAKLVAKLLDSGESFGTGCIDVGKLDALVVLVEIVAVADVE